MPRTSVKGQVLVDLVAKFAEPSLEEEVRTQGMVEKSIGTISWQKPHAGEYMLMAKQTKEASE